MSKEAINQLREHQQQLDDDGIMVGVSRQALDEVLEYVSLMEGEAPLPGSEPSTAGVGDEKDAAITSYYAEGRRGDRTYLPSRIAWELERTAMGDGHYGNALRVAKDLPCVDAADKSLLDRWATGKQYGGDHISLQLLAIKIDQIGDEHDDYTIPPTDAEEVV